MSRKSTSGITTINSGSVVDNRLSRKTIYTVRRFSLTAAKATATATAIAAAAVEGRTTVRELKACRGRRLPCCVLMKQDSNKQLTIVQLNLELQGALW
ncbi:hypothetical protein M0802_008070 [Mischocyttarus mexicanus]|nr:hypothetical protein M0802_008070 [Mischocyttarus mexicanus]